MNRAKFPACRNNDAFEEWGVQPLSYLFQSAFSDRGPGGPPNHVFEP